MQEVTRRCPFCAEEVKAEALKCRFCGEMIGEDAATGRGSSPGGWEYKDVKVPLNVWAKVPSGNFGQYHAARDGAMEAGSAAGAIIMGVLREEGKTGWQPDESVDLLSLFLSGRVGWRQTGGLIFSWKFNYDYAVIRFKRWKAIPTLTPPKPAEQRDRLPPRDWYKV